MPPTQAYDQRRATFLQDGLAAAAGGAAAGAAAAGPAAAAEGAAGLAGGEGAADDANGIPVAAAEADMEDVA